MTNSKLLAARLAEDGDALLRTPFLAAGVVLELLEDAGVPVRVDDALEDVVDDLLLLLGVEVAADVRPGDLPVVGRRESAAGRAFLGVLFLLDVIPVEADGLLLLVGQGLIESLDGRLGGASGTGSGFAARHGEEGQAGGGDGPQAGPEQVAAVQQALA